MFSSSVQEICACIDDLHYYHRHKIPFLSYVRNFHTSIDDHRSLQWMSASCLWMHLKSAKDFLHLPLPLYLCNFLFTVMREVSSTYLTNEVDKDVRADYAALCTYEQYMYSLSRL